MLKLVTNKLVFAAVLVLMTLIACDKSDEQPSGRSAAFTSTDSLLQYVPADSPYVLANVAPLPDDVLDALEPKIDRILQSYEVMLQEIVAMAMQTSDDEGGDSQNAEKVVAVIGELSSLMSLDGLRGAGFERESASVLYGNGLLPVLRIEVSDGALFEAALSRIEESSGEKMDVATIGGNSVRYIEAGEAKILVSIHDEQVVFSIAPANFGDEQLGELLGFTRPESSIAGSGVLQAITNEYEFDDYFVGYIDIERIVETFIGGASGLDATLIASIDDTDNLSDVCRAEIRAMANIAPRVVMGYTDISIERFESQLIVELRDDIAAGLAELTAAVPGLGGDPGGLMSFGLSIDVKAMRDFYETQLDALDEDPFECEKFAELQAGVEKGRLALQQPTPPMVYDFRGFVGVIQDIEGLDMTTQTPPTSVDGRFLLAMNNAPALVSLGMMMSPELAGLDLQPDGEPVQLDLPQAQMIGGNIFVAMTDNALAMSVGDGAESELSGMLTADAEDDGTFFSFSMDAARYYTFIGEAMAAAETDDENPMSPALRAAMQDMVLAVADIYDRMSVDVRFTEKGIVIDSSVTLGE